MFRALVLCVLLRLGVERAEPLVRLGDLVGVADPEVRAGLADEKLLVRSQVEPAPEQEVVVLFAQERVGRNVPVSRFGVWFLPRKPVQDPVEQNLETKLLVRVRSNFLQVLLKNLRRGSFFKSGFSELLN